MSETTCSANPSCEFDKKCGMNSMVLFLAKVSSCEDSEKVNVTILTKILEGNAVCEVAKDEASCSDRISAGCIFEEGICQFDSKRYVSEYVMADMAAGSTTLGIFVELGKLGDVCEMTSSGAETNATTACNANSKCEWDIKKKACDMSAPARNAILSTGNTSAVTAIMVQAFTCSLSSPTSCIAPCARSPTPAGACVYPASEIALSLFGEMNESPMKVIMMKTVMCSMVEISASMNTTTAESSCKAAAKGCSYTMAGVPLILMLPMYRP